MEQNRSKRVLNKKKTNDTNDTGAKRLPNIPGQKSSTQKSTGIASSLKILDKRQCRAFRKIFDDFDLKKSGTLTAEELHECVNKLSGYEEEAISFPEVMQILNDIDVKGTGDIQFDEFIYFMTRPQNLEKMLTDEDRKLVEQETGINIHEEHEESKAEEVMFSILRKVLESDENRDIRSFYRGEIINKLNDHVINDWSDGKRCIGLSNGTMMKRYKNILRRKYKIESRYEEGSPYAKPNMWGVNELRRDIESKKKQRKQFKTVKPDNSHGKPERVKVREMQITVNAVPLPCYKVKQRPDKFTYDDLKQIRVNVSKLKKNYYGYLRTTANGNAKTFYGAVGINNIANKHNRHMTNLAFQSYCNPYVIAPWVPTARRTRCNARTAW